MGVHFNPFDETLQDPFDPQQAIEDPFHGPSATAALQSIPVMPDGNGLYRRFGDFPHGTGYEDALGNPVLAILPIHSIGRMRHEFAYEQAWIAAAEQGEWATNVLEAERQRARLSEKGYAHAFRQTDVCAGGQTLAECETASDMMKEAADYITGSNMDKYEDKSTWTTLAWLGKKCGSCALSCSIAVQPGGITRFTNTKPIEPTPQMVALSMTKR